MVLEPQPGHLVECWVTQIWPRMIEPALSLVVIPSRVSLPSSVLCHRQGFRGSGCVG